MMRTTLDIDGDVLEAAKEIARSSRSSAGKILSDLARKALTSTDNMQGKSLVRNGFELLPAGERVVTDEMVRRLIDEAESA